MIDKNSNINNTNIFYEDTHIDQYTLYINNFVPEKSEKY